MDNTLSSEWTGNRIAIEDALNAIRKARETIDDQFRDLRIISQQLRAEGRNEDADCLRDMTDDLLEAVVTINGTFRRNCNRVSEIR